MWNKVGPESVHDASEQVVMDVRSPAEFAHAHIPGAVNLPLFDNEERSVVGKLYKLSGHDQAVQKGLEIAGPKAPGMVEQARKLAGGRKVLLHCWRGGMRSASVAMLLELAGVKGRILDGGYKRYRQMVHDEFGRRRQIRILGGHTGSGKTAILHHMKDLGEQVIDLEGLARHKGSAFGNLQQAEQPSTEQFENLLYDELRKTDPGKNLWLEDESHSIGKVFLPEGLWKQMREAQVLFLRIPVSARAAFLVEDYMNEQPPAEVVEGALERIRKRLGGQHYLEALELFREGQLDKATEITLVYYDKAYLFGLSKRDQNTISFHEEPVVDPPVIAKNIVKEYAY